MAKKSTSKTIELSSEAAFLPGSGVLMVDDQPGAKPSQPLERKYFEQPLLNWGKRNDLPQQVILMANKSPELLALTQFVVYFMYGGGLTYEVFDDHTGKGRPPMVEGFDSEVEDFFASNNLSNYLLESVIDMVWFNHGFTENILTKSRERIAQIVHQEAAFCRFNKQNPQGYNDTVHINANWPRAMWNDDDTIPVTAINTKDINLLNTVKSAEYYKFMYPTSFPAPGACTYQGANWHSLFESGYFDVSVLVPILKRTLMKYTMTIKYIIKVPERFWINMAKERGMVWEDMKYAERQVLRTKVRDDMNEFLTGAENAGKSFIATFGMEKNASGEYKEIPGISIEPIDDKLKDGIWIADAAEASSQFIRSHNLVPAIVGHLTGKGMGAGSGSDVRVHGNVQNKIMASRRDIILNPLQFVARYNGWTQRLPGFRWKIKEFQFDTLDVNHSTTNEIPSNAPDQE